MADEEVIAEEIPLGDFDASKKKKKKKAKEGDIDAAAEDAAEELSEKVGELSVSDTAVAMDFGKKKKKKKPKEGGEEGEEGDADEAKDDGAVDDSLGEVPLMKKKKKKKQRAEDDELPVEATLPKEAAPSAEAGEEGAAKEEEEDGEEDGEDGDTLDEEAGEIELGGPVKLPWEGTDRDYHYEELLSRVFDILRQKNPELAGDRRRTIMRPPQVLREGTKKTVFVNLMDLCKIMHRQPEHVITFLLAELGTSGSLDGQQRLVVKGRFAPKNFEGLLRRYVTEYVMCHGCKSPDTILSKENRLHFVRCEQCGSHRSVSQIKAGFQAQIGKRAKKG